jgi:AbrB family looped-hinge helix DNA binding protein
MKSQTAKMKDKGQITIPAEIRKSYDLNKGTRVIFEDRGDYIAMIPTRNLVEHLAGSLSKYAPNGPVEIDRDQIWTEIATERWERLLKQEEEGVDEG